MGRDWVLLGAVLLATSVNMALWLSAVPFHHGPDEGAHFQVMRFIRDFGRLPRFDPSELWLLRTPSGAIETYAAFPPLAYLVATIFALPAGAEAMWAARLTSLVACLGTVAITYMLARQLTSAPINPPVLPPPSGGRVGEGGVSPLRNQRPMPSGGRPREAGISPPNTSAVVDSRPPSPALPPLGEGGTRGWSNKAVAVSAALVVGFWPQFAFTGAYINNDALPTCLSAMLYLLLLRAWRHGPSVPVYAGLGLTIGALLLSKYTFYACAGVGMLAALALARDLRRHAVAVLALGSTTAVAAGWWFARNWQLYGEVIPSKVIATAKASAGGNTLFVPSNHGIDLLSVSTQTDFWAVTLRSFVAAFGFLSVYLDGPYYLTLVGLTVVGFVGVIGWARQRQWSPGDLGVAAFIVGVAGVTVLAAMVISTYGEYSPQGRYLFATLVPLALLLALGWHWLATVSRALRWVPVAAVGFVVALSPISVLGYVVPRDFGAPTERITIEIDRPTQPQSADAEVEVLGWSFAIGAVAWHPFDLGPINAYRRPVSGILIYLGGPPGQGAFQDTAHYGFRRRDVGEFYGGNWRLDPIGFRYVFPPGALGPGQHDLYACALAPTVEVPTCARRAIVVLPPP